MSAVWDQDERTLEVARRALEDIGELAHASYRVGYLGAPKGRGGFPSLVVVFDHPQAAAAPALAVALAHPATGVRFRDDTIRRAVRNGVEQYLKKLGVPRPLGLVSHAKPQGD